MKPTETKTATTPERVEHLLFGHGSVIESRTTESGKAVHLVRFDASETDRLILAESLKPSSSAPDAPPKKSRKKPARARKAVDEPISDRLLVEALDDTVTGESESDSEEIQPLAM